MDVLIINGHNYSQYIESGGVSWSRNDLDSDKTKRTKDGRMRRSKICTKRKLSYKLINMDRETMAQLDNDLSAATFEATYRDLHGEMTREFYCSSFTAQMDWTKGGYEQWSNAAFSMIEV